MGICKEIYKTGRKRMRGFTKRIIMNDIFFIWQGNKWEEEGK